MPFGTLIIPNPSNWDNKSWWPHAVPAVDMWRDCKRVEELRTSHKIAVGVGRGCRHLRPRLGGNFCSRRLTWLLSGLSSKSMNLCSFCQCCYGMAADPFPEQVVGDIGRGREDTESWSQRQRHRKWDHIIEGLTQGHSQAENREKVDPFPSLVSQSDTIVPWTANTEVWRN